MARSYSRILVTGAGGFVGPHLIAALSQRFPQAQIRGTHHRDGTRSASDIALDIRDAEAVDRAVSGFAPDGIVHLAALSQVREAQAAPQATFAVNLGGTMNIAEAMRRHVPRARLLYVSSAEVYGASFAAAQGPVDEHAALDPMGVYAASKASAELFLGQAAQHGLEAIRLRSFNHIGPGQSDRFAVSSFVAQIVNIEKGRQEPQLSVGNLDARRDFLDVRDVASAYVGAMACSTLEAGTVLNIASGEARRIGDILESLLKLAKVKVRVVVDPARLRAADIPVAAGDATRARALLGWTPTIAFEATLADMLEARRAAQSS